MMQQRKTMSKKNESILQQIEHARTELSILEKNLTVNNLAFDVRIRLMKADHKRYSISLKKLMKECNKSVKPGNSKEDGGLTRRR